jgi:UPF0755 protein
MDSGEYGAPVTEKPRHRRRGQNLHAAGKFLLVAVVAVVFGAGIYVLKSRYDFADYAGAGSGTVKVLIPEDATLAAMGQALATAGVVASPAAFVDAAREHPRGQAIQSGTFTLRKQMSGDAAVTLLLDPRARVKNGITIPEGKTAKQVYALLAKATGIPLADFTKAGKDPVKLGVPKSWFERDDQPEAARSIEGFLFPDTYEFKPGATATTMLKEMVKHFLAVTKGLTFSGRVRDGLDISPYEALIVASLAQAEAGNVDDLGKIARVAYNRVYSGDFPCDCLEFDVGINYYYDLTGRPIKPSGKMTRAELRDPDNPYRLHGKAGLTPTPINNPGRAALEGAVNPPKGTWLFFVAVDKQGHSAFATTDAEHEENKKIARKNNII